MTATDIGSPSGIPVLLFMVQIHCVGLQNSFWICYICIHWSQITLGHPSLAIVLCLGDDPSCYSIFQGPRQNRMHVHHGGELFHRHAESQTRHLHTIFLANRHTLTMAWKYSILLKCPCNNLAPYAENQAKMVIGRVLLSLKHFGSSATSQF